MFDKLRETKLGIGSARACGNDGNAAGRVVATGRRKPKITIWAVSDIAVGRQCDPGLIPSVLHIEIHPYGIHKFVPGGVTWEKLRLWDICKRVEVLLGIMVARVVAPGNPSRMGSGEIRVQCLQTL